MKSKRSYLLYLEDMFHAMNAIETFLQGLDYSRFLENQMARDAVVRNFEIIGEAAKKIPHSVQKLYPEIPWTQMYRLRNIVSHEYFGVDFAMIWRICRDYLPKNRADLAKVIHFEKEKGEQAGLGLPSA